VTHSQPTKPMARSRAGTRTAKTQSGRPKRPAYDTVGLIDIDDAAACYAAWCGCPEQGDVLKPLLHEGVSRVKNRLRTVQVDAVTMTSLRWVLEFICAARWDARGKTWPSSPDVPDADPDSVESGDDEHDVHDVDDEPGLYDSFTPYALDDDDSADAEVMVDSEHWMRDDDGAKVIVGGSIGEFSYCITDQPPKSAGADIPAGASIGQFLPWLEKHHPGLCWLMEGLLINDSTPAELAWEAGVSESTISRYRATARKLYEAANGTWMDHCSLASSTGASVPRYSRDGRHARGEASRAQIVDVIRFLTWALQKPPAQREILAHVGKSSKHHVERHLKMLIQQGIVRLHANGRGYVVVESSDVAPHFSARTVQ
jgi:hypothetical protein